MKYLLKYLGPRSGTGPPGATGLTVDFGERGPTILDMLRLTVNF